MYHFFKTIIHTGVLSISLIGSASAFAKRNIDVNKACAIYKTEASALPTATVIINYGNVKITYVKDDNKDIYYQALDTNKTLFYATGFMTVKFKKDVLKHEYMNFIKACGLVIEDSNLKSFYLSAPGFNPVVATKALENTQWFDEAYPDFSTYISLLKASSP